MSYNRDQLYKKSYASAWNTLKDSGMKANDPKALNGITLTQSKLRSEVFCNPGETKFQFPILTQDRAPQAPIPQPTNTEIRLRLQDVFFACEISFFLYLGQYLTTTDINTRYYDMTYPDPLFPTAWSGGTPTAGYINRGMGIWTTGQINVQTNNKTVTPLLAVKRCCRVPTFQPLGSSFYPPGDSSAGGTATGMEMTFSPGNSIDAGRQFIMPNFILNGGNNNQYVLTFPAPLSNFGITTAYKMWFVLEFHGYLAQNASSIMSISK